MTEPTTPTHTEVTTLADSAHGNALYLPDAPLIRVSTSGEPDPVTVAIARHISDSAAVFLELPDGRLTVVLHLAGSSRIPERRVAREGCRTSLQHLSDM
jgi:hypothetical protein